MASHFTIHKRAIHPISITWSISPFTLVTHCLFSSISLHLTCIYHPYHLISTHHSSHISYFLVFKRVLYTHFIILADDGCNTATESSQTHRLLRVFCSCYFHYSDYYNKCVRVQCKYCAGVLCCYMLYTVQCTLNSLYVYIYSLYNI